MAEGAGYLEPMCRGSQSSIALTVTAPQGAWTLLLWAPLFISPPQFGFLLVLKDFDLFYPLLQFALLGLILMTTLSVAVPWGSWETRGFLDFP